MCSRVLPWRAVTVLCLHIRQTWYHQLCNTNVVIEKNSIQAICKQRANILVAMTLKVVSFAVSYNYAIDAEEQLNNNNILSPGNPSNLNCCSELAFDRGHKLIMMVFETASFSLVDHNIGVLKAVSTKEK
jgi:hypothetical protein